MSHNVGKDGQSSVDAPSTAIEVRATVVEPPGGTLVFSGTLVFPDSIRAIKVYLNTQPSPRSKSNALDALRRIVRMISGGRSNDPSLFSWATINFEQATAIRAGLYDKTRSGDITPGTANLTLSHLRGLIRAMYGIGLVDPRQHEMTHSNALKNVRGSRTARGRALTSLEERALRASAKQLDGYRGTMLDTAIVLATGGGLRREEVAGLPLDGVEDHEITVIGKGNEERRIPIDAQMNDAVRAWLSKRTAISTNHDRFFCSPQKPEKMLTPWGFWDLVRTTAHAAFGNREPCGETCRCLEVVTGPHDFRRTFATRLLDQGLDLRQVQVLMGHKSPETTARYDKRDVEALFEKRRNMRVIA